MPGKLRTSKLVEPLWELILSRKVQLDVSHYNTLLKVYIDNNHDFSPVDILAKLTENNIEPNRLTFQHLIVKYCQVSFTCKSLKKLFQHSINRYVDFLTGKTQFVYNYRMVISKALIQFWNI